MTFKGGCSQCPQSCKIVNISLLSETHPLLRAILDQQRQTLPVKGKRVIFTEEFGFPLYFIVEYNVIGGGDWKWIYALFSLSVGPSADYPLPELIEIDENGNISNLRKDEFVRGLQEFKDPSECGSLEDKLEGRIGPCVTLAGEAEIRYLGGMIDDIIESLKAIDDNPERWTQKYEHDQRIYWSKKLKHGVLTAGVAGTFIKAIMDVFHCFWSWVRNNVVVLCTLMHFNWKWSINDQAKVVRAFGDHTIAAQWALYIGNNMDNRKCHRKWSVKMNGRICSSVYRNWSHVIKTAAKIAVDYEKAQKDELNVQSGILAAFFFYWTII